jgi:hypothetical protein
VCLSPGSFSADQLSGNGVYYYSNGDIYSGGFRLGKKHGSGQMFFKVRTLQGHANDSRSTAVTASSVTASNLSNAMEGHVMPELLACPPFLNTGAKLHVYWRLGRRAVHGGKVGSPRRDHLQGQL